MGRGALGAELAHGLLQMVISRVGLSGEPDPNSSQNGMSRPQLSRTRSKDFMLEYSFHGKLKHYLNNGMIVSAL